MPITTQKARFAATIILACIAPLAPAFAEPPPAFEARVDKLRNEFGVPGVSIAIVEQGQTTLVKGWGVKRLGTDQKVGPDTLFATGSTGKAFTVAALAILVDRGLIDWDDKVIDHLPDFRMWDPWVTREMTVRDLLVHRSGLGLGAGDLLFVPNSDRSRAETVRALRFIKPATSFRSGYAYDNLLYIVAGELIESVTGRTWEDFVLKEVLAPLGMSRATVTDDDRFKDGDRAQPHARLGGSIRGTGHQQTLDEGGDTSQNAAPAGGLAISARDMSKWLKVQLARGQLPGSDRRLYSDAAAAQMWAPVILQPIAPRPPELSATKPLFYTYALGWDVQDYRGTRIVWHGGAVAGFLTAVVLIPEKNVGFSIAINSEDGELVRGLMYELLDHYLDLPQDKWPEKLHAFKMRQISELLKSLPAPAQPEARIARSVNLERYAGSFEDAWYGRISVTMKNGSLFIDFPRSKGMRGPLEHWNHDTFRTRFEDSAIEPALVTFILDADDQVERVTMKPFSPAADFSYDYQDLLFRPAKDE